MQKDLSKLIAAFLSVMLFLAEGARAEEPPADDASQTDQAEGVDEESPAIVGFDLGHYFIKQTRTVEGANTKLAFTLHGSVTEDRAAELQRLLETRTNRVRDQVITAARITEPLEFGDPDLERFRRRIMVRLSRSLPELPIDALYFSEFSYLVE